MNLEQIRPFLSYQFKSDSELTASIELLSKNFTSNRNKLSDYLSDPKLVSAYTCFYLTTNIPKLSASLSKFDFSVDLAEYEWIDIGMGPGTFSLSLFEMDASLKIYGLENSEQMLTQANSLVKGLYPEADWRGVSDYKSIPEKSKKRIGIFGHSANEMGESFILKLIEELDLDEILFIEPGTKEFFKKMRNLRTKLISKQFNNLYPCSDKGACPMPEDDWCHQYVKVTHDVSVERLSQMGKKDRRLLPLTLHFYSRLRDFNHQKSVITRQYEATKFSCEWQICSECKLRELQVMFRGMKKSEVKELKAFLPGKLISFDIEKNLEHNKVRGKLL